MEPIALRPWSDQDLPLLRLANTPEMTAYLNGPETEEQVLERHQRYLRLTAAGEARVFVIVEGDVPLGSIGCWHVEWKGEPAFETGWFVLPAAQDRGVASMALSTLIEDVREHRGERRMLTAYPGADNAASNGVCRRNGFTMVGTFTGTFRDADLALNEWVLDLSA